jgi:uncharacterized membrane protein YgcG
MNNNTYLPAAIVIAIAAVVPLDRAPAQQAIDFSKPEVNVVNFNTGTTTTTAVEVPAPEFDFSKEPIEVTNFVAGDNGIRCIDGEDLECSGNGDASGGASGGGGGMGGNGEGEGGDYGGGE